MSNDEAKKVKEIIAKKLEEKGIKTKKEKKVPKKAPEIVVEKAPEKKPPLTTPPPEEKKVIEGFGDALADLLDGVFNILKTKPMTPNERKALTELLNKVLVIETKVITFKFEYALITVLSGILIPRVLEVISKPLEKAEKPPEKKEILSPVEERKKSLEQMTYEEIRREKERRGLT